MKKITFFTIILLLLTSLFSIEITEYKEENGIEVNSHNRITGQRTSRDIPEDGLLLIPDWSADRVMAFDPITGALYDADFIPSDETNLSSPKEATMHPNGNSILVSDQIEDGLIQYDLDGNYMSYFAPAGGPNNAILDNVRGWGLKADGNILVTTASGSNSDAIAEFDTAGNYIGNFIAPNSSLMDGPFCILYREAQDDYLITASSSDAVHQYDNTGSYIGDLVTGINFPQQIALAANGNLLVAGFSTPSGCYEYTSDGAFVGLYDVVTGLRGVYELPNGNILVTDANGVYEISRNNTLVNTILTGASAQFIHFVEGGGGVFDPPTNVAVDPQTGTVSWFPPVVAVIDDNFDSYTVGDYIAEVGDDWTTWSGTPGGAEDALVTDVQSNSPDNSILVELNNDLILIMEDYQVGKVVVDLKMYVPTGYAGYYNLQQTTIPGEFWGFQIYFHTDGTVSADCGEEGNLTFDYDHDAWMDCSVVVDMDNDLASYYHDGQWMIDWQWSLGTFGNVQVNQLGGVNIFGGAHSTMPTDVPMFYVDDVVVSEVLEDVTGFNVYLDGILDATVGEDVTEYTYQELVGNQAYMAGVSAVYGGDESDVIDVPFYYYPVTSFDPPIYPVAIVEDYNDVLITWELPGGGERIQHHTGYDANGIGTGAAADFICAARFTADELAAYYGSFELTGVNVLLHSLDFSYVAIQVYEGGSYGDPGTLVYDEEITGSVLMGEFTNHLLSTPVPLVSGNEYWIGYDIQATSDHPAAVDAGPMVPDKGAWMYFSAAWQTLPELGATLDFNWIINGVVSESDAVASNGNNRSEVIGRAHTLRSSSQLEAEVAYDSRREATNPATSNSRSLAGYTVYRDGTEIADIADPAILSYTDECLDAGTYEYSLEAY